MALIKLGIVAANVSGSVNGVVFARNAGGAYIRNRTVPTQPISEKRSQRRALMTQLVDLWQNTLSTAQRVAWNELAKVTNLTNRLGESFNPSGMNLYIRSNYQLALSGQTLITAAPTSALTPSFAPPIGHVVDSGIQVTSIGEFDDSLTGQIIYQRSAPLPLSVNYFKGPWATLTSGAIATVAAPAFVLAANADLITDARYFFRFVTVTDDGAVSAPTIAIADTPSSLTT